MDVSSQELTDLVVISDSLAFYGPTGGLAASDPRIWPCIVGNSLDLRVELVGRVGWTSRDAWWAMTGDPRLWAAMPRAAALILAVGGMDSLPSPLPTALREQIRYIRPASLRAKVRNAYGWLQPKLAPLGWPVALPPSVSIAYLDRIYGAVHALRPDLPVVIALPPTHRAPSYGFAHKGHAPMTSAMTTWAAQKQLPTVDMHALSAPFFAHGDHNPDGIHWGFSTHRAVAAAAVQVVKGAIEQAPEHSHLAGADNPNQ